MRTSTHIELDNISSTYVGYNLAIEFTADKGDSRVTANVTEEQARSLARQLADKIKRIDDDRIHEAERLLEKAEEVSDSE